MTTQVRLRRHTDGRVALRTATSYVFQWFSTGPDGNRWLTDEYVSGPGWSELLVAALPEPDGWLPGNLDRMPWWRMTYGQIVTAGDGEIGGEGWGRNLAEIRSDALKMLAAVAACEQYRAQREATT